MPETPPTAAVEIRALYEDFRRMAQAIARRSLYLRDFAAAVSHEFKTPLGGIRGATELLQDHHGTMSDAERSRFLGNIGSDTDRLSDLVTRLLDLARADMARSEAPAATRLETAVRRTVDAFASTSLSVDAHLPSDLPFVAVSETVIESVLTTLMENSRQAGATHIVLTARRTVTGTELDVSDDGRGVPEADRERLFEPFFTSRRDSGGTGLGSSIAKSLLSVSHSTIEFVPYNDKTLFRISIPGARLRPSLIKETALLD